MDTRRFMRNIDGREKYPVVQIAYKLSKQEWDDLVKSMIGKGANVEDKDVPVLVDYPAKTNGK